MDSKTIGKKICANCGGEGSVMIWADADGVPVGDTAQRVQTFYQCHSCYGYPLSWSPEEIAEHKALPEATSEALAIMVRQQPELEGYALGYLLSLPVVQALAGHLAQCKAEGQAYDPVGLLAVARAQVDLEPVVVSCDKCGAEVAEYEASGHQPTEDGPWLYTCNRCMESVLLDEQHRAAEAKLQHHPHCPCGSCEGTPEGPTCADCGCTLVGQPEDMVHLVSDSPEGEIYKICDPCLDVRLEGAEHSDSCTCEQCGGPGATPEQLHEGDERCRPGGSCLLCNVPQEGTRLWYRGGEAYASGWAPVRGQLYIRVMHYGEDGQGTFEDEWVPASQVLLYGEEKHHPECECSKCDSARGLAQAEAEEAHIQELEAKDRAALSEAPASTYEPTEHEPVAMPFTRYGSSHRASVRQHSTTRRHWMRLYKCPECGNESTQLDNASHGKGALMCNGLRWYWEASQKAQQPLATEQAITEHLEQERMRYEAEGTGRSDKALPQRQWPGHCTLGHLDPEDPSTIVRIICTAPDKPKADASGTMEASALPEGVLKALEWAQTEGCTRVQITVVL